MHAEELQALLDASPVHGALHLLVLASGDGAVTLGAEPGREHALDGDAHQEGDAHLHGGVIATMLDTAATFALIDATGTDWSTVDLRVDYLRPAPLAPLRVTGKTIQVGSRLGRASSELEDPATGRTLASAVGTFVRA